MDAKEGSPEGDELDILGTLAEAYEAKHVTINRPNPVEFIRFRLDQLRLSCGLHTVHWHSCSV